MFDSIIMKMFMPSEIEYNGVKYAPLDNGRPIEVGAESKIETYLCVKIGDTFPAPIYLVPRGKIEQIPKPKEK